MDKFGNNKSKIKAFCNVSNAWGSLVKSCLLIAPLLYSDEQFFKSSLILMVYYLE